MSTARKKKVDIGDGDTQYGFDYANLIRVERACSGRPGERRRFAAIRIRTANGDYINIDATPRNVHVLHVKAESEIK